MDTIMKIIMAATIVEAVIEYLSAIGAKELHFKCLASIGFGMAFAIFFQIDLLAAFGLTSGVPFAGMALTGILLSRGSNCIADLLKKLGA